MNVHVNSGVGVETLFSRAALQRNGGRTARYRRSNSAQTEVSRARVKQILRNAERIRLSVIGDLMLDQFLWGNVRRISPEAPVPVVEFERESYMPGGAANVARNLSSLEIAVDLAGLVGRDDSARKIKHLLSGQGVNCDAILGDASRPTSIKTRIIAHQQQIVRVDREQSRALGARLLRRLLKMLQGKIATADAVILCDYGKGVICQEVLDRAGALCKNRGVWLSLDPKPVHQLTIQGPSLLTPNRKEAFELAGIEDSTGKTHPLSDERLMKVAEILLTRLQPKVLLITLGHQGMLLCEGGQHPVHIPTVAQEVFDVSGAGDTVIATFTMAIAAGGSALEAAIISNHAAGIVVGKFGTATLSRQELVNSFVQ